MSGAGVVESGENQGFQDGKNPNLSPYSEGDRVLIPQHSLIYEAKIEKTMFESKLGWKYFVHYMGWNKKYDEWMQYASLKKFDESVKITKPTRANQGGGQQKKRRKTEVDEDYDIMVKIPLPTLLKNKLVAEWDAITREGKLIPLPKKEYTVAQILEEFNDLVDRREPWPEITDGLRTYFNKTLKAMLLYPEERKQSEEVLKNGKLPQDVYGVEHLVRLFLKLPDILPFTNLDEESLVALVARLQSIVTFIKDNGNAFYTDFE
mmetsp:Transcript_8052/g.14978  ORF Transcript_8052/g.14978 Transcript_8052/m.14978 type:complete len:263 (+) Transcript_8052:64-852(+)